MKNPAAKIAFVSAIAILVSLGLCAAGGWPESRPGSAASVAVGAGVLLALAGAAGLVISLLVVVTGYIDGTDDGPRPSGSRLPLSPPYEVEVYSSKAAAGSATSLNSPGAGEETEHAE